MQNIQCPHCAKKLQVPNQLPEGTLLQCSGCNNQFLPPDPSVELSVNRSRSRKKRRKEKVREKWTARSYVLVGSLTLIAVMLGILATIWLMQPGYAKFNDQIVAQYNKFTSVLQTQISRRSVNSPVSFLKQFEKLGPQLKPILDDLAKIRAPSDAQPILTQMTKLVESMKQFSESDVPRFLEELKRKPNSEEIGRELITFLYTFSNTHEALMTSQHSMARTHGLYQLQAAETSLFSSRDP